MTSDAQHVFLYTPNVLLISPVFGIVFIPTRIYRCKQVTNIKPACLQSDAVEPNHHAAKILLQRGHRK